MSSEHWGTPNWLFDALGAGFGPFDLDPCARNASESKCVRFVTPGLDGLAEPWRGGGAFVNPPFDNPSLERWAGKCAAERAAPDSIARIVLLAPVRPAQACWRYAMQQADAHIWIDQRVRFVPLDGQKASSPSGETMAFGFRRAAKPGLKESPVTYILHVEGHQRHNETLRTQLIHM